MILKVCIFRCDLLVFIDLNEFIEHDFLVYI